MLERSDKWRSTRNNKYVKYEYVSSGNTPK